MEESTMDKSFGQDKREKGVKESTGSHKAILFCSSIVVGTPTLGGSSDSLY